MVPDSKLNLSFNISSIFLCNSSCDNLSTENKAPFPIDIVWLWNGNEFDMRYSLRSVCLFIAWYHKIFIIVPRSTQLPKWINKSYVDKGQITFIKEQYFFTKFNLTNATKHGTNNSEQIESMIHHISTLSEHFIYFNDDMMIGRRIPWRFFYKYNDEHGRYLSNIHPTYFSAYSHAMLNTNAAYECGEAHPQIMALLKANKLPKGRVNSYIEHHPRAYIKSELFLFESMFAEFFEVIRNHNGERFNSCNDHRLYFEESIWFYMMRYKIDETLPYFHANILQKYDLQSDKIYHSWLRNQAGKLFGFMSCLKEISRLRPYTFTIQGDWMRNNEQQQVAKYALFNFYEQYFSPQNNRCLKRAKCAFENQDIYDEIEEQFKIKQHRTRRFHQLLASGIHTEKIRAKVRKSIHVETPSEHYDLQKIKANAASAVQHVLFNSL